MKKLNWLLKYDLFWYLERLRVSKESTEQYKEVIEILEIILGNPKGSKDSKSTLDAVTIVDTKSIQEAIPRLVQLTESKNVQPIEATYLNAQSIEATYLLGAIYLYGIGVDQDMKRAVAYFQSAADCFHGPALCELGCCHEQGSGVDQDFSKAYRFYALSSKHRWAPAYYALAQRYEHGRSVAKNMHKAANYFNLASEQGYAPAQNDLGVFYRIGNGVEQNLERAVELYRSAAEKGSINAQVNLASCYLSGSGVEKDIGEALKNNKPALAQGHRDAQFNLAFCYGNGDGVGLDFKRHIELCTLSASQGDPSALQRLALSYFAGVGVNTDLIRASILFSAAFERGYPGDFIGAFVESVKLNKRLDLQLDAFQGFVDFIYKKKNTLGIDLEANIDIDNIDDKYIEFLPNLALSYQISGDAKIAEKLFLKAIEYYRKKGDLQAISRLHWDLYFCYQSQHHNEDKNYFEVEFDTKVLSEFYEKIRWSVKEGNYHDLELLAYMNEQSEINLEGNWYAAVQCYHQFSDQVQKEMGEMRHTRDTGASDKAGLKEDGGWLEALDKLGSGDILEIIDSQDSPEQILRVRQRKIERAQAKLKNFTHLSYLHKEILDETGLNPSIAALVVAYERDTDVQKYIKY